MVNCDIHGIVGANPICLHAKAALENGIVIEAKMVSIKYFIIRAAFLCSDCESCWKGLKSDREKDEFLSGLVFMCPTCFDEALADSQFSRKIVRDAQSFYGK